MQTKPVRLVGHDRPPEPLRFTFTVEKLNRVRPSDRQRWVYDTRVAGLALCVTPGGVRTFYFAKRMQGRYRRVKIGRFPNIAIDRARTIARRLDGEVAEGKSPADQRRIARSAWTFAQLFEYYLEHHAKVKKRTWREDEQKYNDYLAPLRSRKLTEIRKADVQAIVTKIGTHKTRPRKGAANRVAALVSAVFNFGIDQLDLPVANPARGIRRFPERGRERYLNADELQRFYAAIESEPAIFRDFFELCLLTGARSGNIKRMRWEQLDLDEALWIIPADEAKAGRLIAVALSPRAVEIIARRRDEARRLAEESGEPMNPWVFPSYRRNPKCPHLVEAKGSWRRITEAAGLADLRIHDLRHTNASWQGKTGANLTTIGKALGHSRPITTLGYTHTELDEVRKSMNAAAQAMREAAGVAEGSTEPARPGTREKRSKRQQRASAQKGGK